MFWDIDCNSVVDDMTWVQIYLYWIQLLKAEKTESSYSKVIFLKKAMHFNFKMDNISIMETDIYTN